MCDAFELSWSLPYNLSADEAAEVPEAGEALPELHGQAAEGYVLLRAPDVDAAACGPSLLDQIRLRLIRELLLLMRAVLNPDLRRHHFRPLAEGRADALLKSGGRRAGAVRHSRQRDLARRHRDADLLRRFGAGQYALRRGERRQDGQAHSQPRQGDAAAARGLCRGHRAGGALPRQ